MYKDVYKIKRLPFDLWFCQYWPSEFFIQKGGNPRGNYEANKRDRAWCKYFKLPWFKSPVAHEWMRKDRSWYDAKNNPENIEWAMQHKDPQSFQILLPVAYTMRSGEVQSAHADVTYIRRKWAHHWLRWAKALYPWRYEIGIDFDTEMGSERGSWKGGVVGIHSDVKKGESIKDCLERTMKERDFCRR